MTIRVHDLPPADRPPTEPEAFLRWAARQERKYELHRENVVMMTGVKRAHGVIATRVLRVLADALDDRGFQVFQADFAVKTALGVRYPDVVVDATAGGPDDLAAAAPVLIAEVLSSSSYETDFVLKADEYKALPTLRHYLILAQDEPRVWLWSRGEAGWPEASTMSEGHDATVELADLGLSLPLARIYRGFPAITG